MRHVNSLHHTRWECKYHARCLYRAVTPRIRPDRSDGYDIRSSGLIPGVALTE